MTLLDAHSVAADLLPSAEPIRLLGGSPSAGYHLPSTSTLLSLYRQLVLARRFNQQCTALAKQGRLAVYPSSEGQEACQVGTVAAMASGDWLFPTYRDTAALMVRGIEPVQALSLLRGEWHCGYDPKQHRTAPQCTPVATHCLHASGFAHAAALKGEDTVALCLLGDGATSEGDTHEALNFAAVFGAPVVFFVQNNGYAISVPVRQQSKAPSLACKAVGYGMTGQVVDGNDVAAVYAVTARALASARAGRGPALIEALTYRVEPHTNSDDANRYRAESEPAQWRHKDPIQRLEQHLANALTDEMRADINAEADAMAADLRTTMSANSSTDTADLFAHVYAEMTPQLRDQAAFLTEELRKDQP